MIAPALATTTCMTAYSCDSDSIADSWVDCDGYMSCSQTSIAANGNLPSISCYGSYSCYQSGYLKVISTSTDYGGAITCAGLFSCAFVDTIYNYWGSISCRGELSCFNSNVYFGSSSLYKSIYITGDHAFSKSTLLNGYNHRVYASFGAQNATFISTVNNTMFYMFGNYAGYGATIICGSGLDCNIYCSGNGCNELNLICNGTSRFSCNFVVDCSSAQQSNICPNGYTIDQLQFQVPSLMDVKLSTIENSYNACLTTNAVNCGDFYNSECVSASGVGVGGAVCCTAWGGCYRSSYPITTRGIALNSNSTVIDQTAIRCDAFQSCFVAKLTAQDGGNVYLTAWGAGDYSTLKVVETTVEYNIICSGYQSCSQTWVSIVNGFYVRKVLQNALNVICTGSDSCSGADMINIHYAYLYGVSSGELSTIENVFGSVYCSAFTACSNSTIQNVKENVFAGGYKALSFSNISNVTNVCANHLCSS